MDMQRGKGCEKAMQVLNRFSFNIRICQINNPLTTSGSLKFENVKQTTLKLENEHSL
mgnify:CR=1 FL=1